MLILSLSEMAELTYQVGGPLYQLIRGDSIWAHSKLTLQERLFLFGEIPVLYQPYLGIVRLFWYGI